MILFLFHANQKKIIEIPSHEIIDIIRSSTEIYYPHKKTLFLDCHVSGVPRPTIQWFKQGFPLKNSETFTIKNKDDGTCELHLFMPDRWDSGRYLIRATNSVGKAELEHVINWKNTDEDMVEEFLAKKRDDKDLKKIFKSKYIKEEDWECYGVNYKSKREKEKEVDPKKKLKFITHLSNQTVSVGSVLSMKCFVDGSCPQYLWYKEDMPIVHGRKYYMKTKRDGKVELDVRNVQTSDAGTYYLVCKNWTGEIETKAEVTVYQNPFQKIDPPVFGGTIAGIINVCTVLNVFNVVVSVLL